MRWHYSRFPIQIEDLKDLTFTTGFMWCEKTFRIWSYIVKDYMLQRNIGFSLGVVIFNLYFSLKVLSEFFCSKFFSEETYILTFGSFSCWQNFLFPPAIVILSNMSSSSLYVLLWLLSNIIWCLLKALNTIIKKSFPKNYTLRGPKWWARGKLQYKNGSKLWLCPPTSNRLLHRKCLHFH